MKKLRFLSIIALFATAMMSCNQTDWLWDDPLAVDGVMQGKSKIYRGGNVECSQLPGILGLPSGFTFDLTTGRNNFNYGVFDYLWSEWEGLEVRVSADGKVVDWYTPGTITNKGLCYKVAAVIVKGGDASNIYYYPGGAQKDKGLVAPDNSSGGPAALSNLTFCFIESDCPEPLVIAVKSRYHEEGQTSWTKYTLSAGKQVFTTNWCGTDYLGVNSYPGIGSFDMWTPGMMVPIGKVTVGNFQIKVELYGGLILDETYVYVGTEEALKSSNINPFDNCPYYTNSLVWLQNKTTGTSVHYFDMP